MIFKNKKKNVQEKILLKKYYQPKTNLLKFSQFFKLSSKMSFIICVSSSTYREAFHHRFIIDGFLTHTDFVIDPSSTCFSVNLSLSSFHHRLVFVSSSTNWQFIIEKFYLKVKNPFHLIENSKSLSFVDSVNSSLSSFQHRLVF